MKLTLRIAIIAGLILILLAVFLIYGRADSEQYSGDMLDGQPHGFGRWKHPSGVSYTGEFMEGLWHGRGTWIHPDGIKYAGEWQQGEYHGRGILRLANGAIYYGSWVRGEKEGPGIFKWPDGKSYTGWWVEDRQEGFGILVTSEGFNYRGQWLDGRRHGEGTAIYPDGSEYYGHWLNDKRHGLGTMIFADGSIYEGSWSDDRKHGEGTITYPDGTFKTAVWVRGSLQEVPIKAISIDPGTVSLIAGGASTTLTAEILPEDATNQKITWATSNPSVATVTEGIVRPINPGSATITAKTTDGGHTAVCTVTVSTTAVSVTGVSLDRTSITLRVGETASLIATVSPSNATNSSVNWASSDSTVAAVYQESGRRGGVRAFNPGEVWVTVTTLDGQRSARCQVTILPKEDPANKVIVPRLIGNPLETAKAMITAAGLAVGDIRSEYHASALPDQVISQTPAVGATANKGSLVNLVISRGPEPLPDPEPEPEPEDPEENDSL